MTSFFEQVYRCRNCALCNIFCVDSALKNILYVDDLEIYVEVWVLFFPVRIAVLYRIIATYQSNIDNVSLAVRSRG